MLLFPERAAASRGPMREFKEGAAYIAITAGVPAVPLGIAGTRDVLPMGSNYVRGGPVVLKIGDPIPTAGMKLHDRSQLIARLEREVAELSGQYGRHGVAASLNSAWKMVTGFAVPSRLARVDGAACPRFSTNSQDRKQMAHDKPIDL